MPGSTTWCRRRSRWAPAAWGRLHAAHPERPRQPRRMRANASRRRSNAASSPFRPSRRAGFRQGHQRFRSDRLLVFCDENAPVANPVDALRRLVHYRNRRYRGPRRGFYGRGESACRRPRVGCVAYRWGRGSCAPTPQRSPPSLSFRRSSATGDEEGGGAADDGPRRVGTDRSTASVHFPENKDPSRPIGAGRP